MLRSYLIEQGRAQSDVETLVAKSEAIRLQLSQDSTTVRTQKEISGLMFHLHDFDRQFEFYVPRSPPDCHFAPDALVARRERAFVEYRLFSSKQPCDASFGETHYVTIEILRTCNVLHEPDCIIRYRDTGTSNMISSHPTMDRAGAASDNGVCHTFKIDNCSDVLKRCARLHDLTTLGKTWPIRDQMGDLISSDEPVSRYTWLTIRTPKPPIHVKVNVNEGVEYGSSGHWEGTLSAQILRYRS